VAVQIADGLFRRAANVNGGGGGTVIGFNYRDLGVP